MSNEHENPARQENSIGSKLLYALLVVALALAAFNQMAIGSLSQSVSGNVVATESTRETTVTYDPQNLQAAVNAVIPTGTATFGDLEINYDKPIEALEMLAKMDGDLYPDGVMHFADLAPEQQQRYIQIGTSIACEYCCGATTLVQRNGQPACGCAHSAAMRGLAMYLLKNTDLNNEEILNAITDVKAISFPQQMVQKYMQQNGMIQGTPSQQGSQGITGLPSQVGGC